MHVERHEMTLESDASQVASGDTPPVTGRVLQIHYVKDDFTDGVDITVTCVETGQVIWAGTNVNASVVVAPRMATVASEDGSAALYAGSGEEVRVPIAVANGRIRVAVAAAGVGKFGTFHVVVG